MMDDDDFELPQVQPGLPGQKKKPGISSFVKGGTALMITAFVDMIVAFSTAHWATWTNEENGEFGGYGLWKVWHCTRKDGSTSMPGVQKMSIKNLMMGDKDANCQEKMADLSFEAWYVAVQVFQSLGLAGLFLSVVMLFLYMFLPKWDQNKSVISTLIAIAYMSGLFNAVALAVFGLKVAEELEFMNISEWILSWSFSLACTAFVLNQIAASILVTESKRLTNDNDENTKSLSPPIYTKEITKTELQSMLPR